MKKICVYTCITGSYDNVTELKYKEKNIDYILFTNNTQIKSDTWNIIYLDENIDNWNLARKVKILSYKYLKDYEITVWIDGSMELLQPVSLFIEKECDLDKYDMIGFKHQERDCIYQEISINAFLNKENVEKLKNIEMFLRKENYPEHNGLIESSVLVRKNTNSVNKLMDDWYKILTKYTNRDQLSFNYCLWKNPIKIKLINMYAQNNKYFKNNWHKKEIKTAKNIILYYDKMPDDINNINFSKLDIIPYSKESFKKGITFKVNNNCKEINILLKNENYSKILSASTNKDIELIVPKITISSGEYLPYNPIILLKKEFKENDMVKIKFDLRESDINTIVSELNNALYKKIEENNKLNNNISEINNQIEEKNNIISDLTNNISDKEIIIKSLSNELEQKNIELNNVYNSKSWKITKPLRKITNTIKRK